MINVMFLLNGACYFASQIFSGMSQTHIHLLVTHLPIFGALLGLIVLIHGLWTRNNQTLSAAYILFLISSLGAVVSYFTGEPAEESVENIQGVAKQAIEQHEDSALFALVALIILGIAAIFSLLLNYKQSALIRKAAFMNLFISIISFILIARTGYLGGLVRHTEITNTSIQTSEPGQEEKKDDD